MGTELKKPAASVILADSSGKEKEENPNVAVSDPNANTADGSTEEKTLDTASGEDEYNDYISGTKLALVCSSVTLVVFLMLLDMTVLVTVGQVGCVDTKAHQANLLIQAIPRITTEFKSLQDVGWYGAAYNLARYYRISTRSDIKPFGRS